AALSQPLQRILADRLQHGEAWLVITSCDTLHHLLVEERVQPIEDACSQRSYRSANLLSGVECPAAGEDSQAAEQELLTHIEQLIAPVDRRTQRALALGQVARPIGQQCQ